MDAMDAVRVAESAASVTGEIGLGVDAEAQLM
jgi:hypothetical protein